MALLERQVHAADIHGLQQRLPFADRRDLVVLREGQQFAEAPHAAVIDRPISG